MRPAPNSDFLCLDIRDGAGGFIRIDRYAGKTVFTRDADEAKPRETW